MTYGMSLRVYVAKWTHIGSSANSGNRSSRCERVRGSNTLGCKQAVFQLQPMCLDIHVLVAPKSVCKQTNCACMSRFPACHVCNPRVHDKQTGSVFMMGTQERRSATVSAVSQHASLFTEFQVHMDCTLRSQVECPLACADTVSQNVAAFRACPFV